jgi:ABC-2 type transport system ATP-binding protein
MLDRTKNEHSSSDLQRPGDLPSNVLSVQRLKKVYGETVAVDDISFVVRRNEIVGLLGPNGAGKTTTINMVLGVLEPTSGSILIQGIDVAKRRREALKQTNFAAVYAPLPGNLSVVQNLRIFGMIYGVKNLPERIEALLEQFELKRFRDTKCGVLSSGEQTRVSLAKAMLSFCSMNPPHRWIPPLRTMSASRFASLHAETQGYFGPLTTCMR